MSVQSYLIEHNGRYVGHALTLGTRLIFHAARDDLSSLDEACFDSLEKLQAAVADALAGKSGSLRRNGLVKPYANTE